MRAIQWLVVLVVGLLASAVPILVDTIAAPDTVRRSDQVATAALFDRSVNRDRSGPPLTIPGDEEPEPPSRIIVSEGSPEPTESTTPEPTACLASSASGLRSFGWTPRTTFAINLIPPTSNLAMGWPLRSDWLFEPTCPNLFNLFINRA